MLLPLRSHKIKFIQQSLTKRSGGGRREREIQTISNNVRLRAAARRDYLHATFRPVGDSMKRELLCMHRAPSTRRTLEIFPDLEECRYLGNAGLKRAELLKDLDNFDVWSLEDMLECCGCCVHGTTQFNLLCETEGVYDLWQDEYIQALAARLRGRRMVLEVGAGSGRLTALLRGALASTTEIVATDNGAWRKLTGMSSKSTHNAVVQMPFDKAIEHFQPDAVLCSWMPMQEDWTKTLRKRRNSSIQEYILIGDSSCTGRFVESWREGEGGAQTVDGFAKLALDGLRAMQYCRHDRLPRRGYSQTTSFTRV